MLLYYTVTKVKNIFDTILFFVAQTGPHKVSLFLSSHVQAKSESVLRAPHFPACGMHNYALTYADKFPLLNQPGGPRA